MRRANNGEQVDSDDSFLDVVANIVGVLIILVMLVGVRASQSAVDVSVESAPVAESHSDGVDVAAEVAHLKRQSKELTQRKWSLKEAAQLEESTRMQLLMHIKTIENDLAERRARLTGHQQQQFDVQNQIAEAQLALDELTREQLSLSAPIEEIEELECVPTPLAQQVDGREVHLRLRGGVVSIVPIDELHAELDRNLLQLQQRFRDRGELDETFGPIDGYRLRVEAVRRAILPTPGTSTLGQPNLSYVDHIATFLPVSDDIGQSVEQMLMPGSPLNRRLKELERESPTVTIWVYGDSFAEFRLLKREFWERGLAVAVRPLGPQAHIASSPRGSRSAAQ